MTLVSYYQCNCCNEKFTEGYGFVFNGNRRGEFRITTNLSQTAHFHLCNLCAERLKELLASI